MKPLIALSVGLASVFIVSWSSVAYACQCADQLARDTAYDAADYVFFGEVVDDEGSRALTVLENYKGTRSKRTHAIGAAGACDFRFEVGKSYIVYANKGDAKDEVVVDQCGATTQLDHAPLNASIWDISDELVYRTPRRTADAHKRARDTVTSRAVGKIKWALKKCHGEVWGAKDDVKARVEVRFDIEPDGKYTHELLKYETATPPSDAVKQCLAQRLAEDDFKSFPGGRISVASYWIIDWLDPTFGEDRSSATVIPYKSKKRLLE